MWDMKRKRQGHPTASYGRATGCRFWGIVQRGAPSRPSCRVRVGALGTTRGTIGATGKGRDAICVACAFIGRRRGL